MSEGVCVYVCVGEMIKICCKPSRLSLQTHQLSFAPSAGRKKRRRRGQRGRRKMDDESKSLGAYPARYSRSACGRPWPAASAHSPGGKAGVQPDRKTTDDAKREKNKHSLATQKTTMEEPKVKNEKTRMAKRKKRKRTDRKETKKENTEKILVPGSRDA